VTFTDPISSDVMYESVALPDEDASLYLDVLDYGFPCDNSVEILLTKPSLAAAYPTVEVALTTVCDSISNFVLNKNSYDTGYIGEVTVEHGACGGSTTCTEPVIGYDDMYTDLYVTFIDPVTGEILDESIGLPEPITPDYPFWFIEYPHEDECNEIELFLCVPTVPSNVSSVSVDVTSSGYYGTRGLTRSYYNANSGYQENQGFGGIFKIENNNGRHGLNCCGGITYMNNETVNVYFDGSPYGTVSVNGLVSGLETIESPSMTLTQISTGLSSPCDVGVRIEYTLPVYRRCTGSAYDTYTVLVEDPSCNRMIHVTLTRDYYEDHGGESMMGYGGEIVVEPVACGGSSSCSSNLMYNPGGPIIVRDASPYGVSESITITQ
jgi:hypothetical protein